MNDSNPIGGSNYSSYTHALQSESPAGNSLPPKVLQNMLSLLEGMGKQEVDVTLRQWSASTVDKAKQEELTKIKRFAQFLGENLKGEAYAKQRQKLFEIFGETQSLNSIAIENLKSSMHKYKESILNVLKDLPEDELKNLEQESQNIAKPIFFENVFALVPIYKKIDAAKNLAEDSKRDMVFGEIIVKLAIQVSTNKAIEVASNIKNDYLREHAITGAPAILVFERANDKAIEFANSLPTPEMREKGLYSVYLAMVINPSRMESNLDECLRFIRTLPDGATKDRMLEDISGTFAIRGEIETSRKIANEIKDESTKKETFLNIKVISDRQGFK